MYLIRLTYVYKAKSSATNLKVPSLDNYLAYMIVHAPHRISPHYCLSDQPLINSRGPITNKVRHTEMSKHVSLPYWENTCMDPATHYQLVRTSWTAIQAWNMYEMRTLYAAPRISANSENSFYNYISISYRCLKIL